MTNQPRKAVGLIAGLFVLASAFIGTVFVPNAQADNPPPDLWIDKAILETPPYAVGQEVSFVLVVTNIGGEMPPGSSVIARDLLPVKADLLEASEAARGKLPHFLGVTCSSEDRDVLCELPAPLAAGDHFVVRIRVELTGPGNLVNHAWTTAQGSQELPRNNNHEQLSIQVD
jgi:hypothetical protein